MSIPLKKSLLILIGFPAISTLLSLLLLRRNIFDQFSLDFFSIFWGIILLWYVAQLIIVIKILHSENYALADIGYRYNFKQSAYFVLGYFLVAFLLFAMVEYALATSNVDPEKIASLSDLSDITPKTTTQRVIFILVGLFAGLSEEFIYRGFALETLRGYKINKWLCVLVASIPFVFQHGLKSIDQFWWFLSWGIIFGVIYWLSKRRLQITIIIHWLVILSALLAILQVLD